MGNVAVNEIMDESFGNCIEISNGEIILTVTVDFGPRIIRFGFCSMGNILCEKAPITVGSEFGTWRLVGGHRFTHSPENVPRTYMPDNMPVKYEILENGVRILQNEEKWTQISKTIKILMDSEKNEVIIEHGLINRGAWPVELSVWSITAMAKGGIEIIPQPSEDTGVLPNRNIVLWPYSSMADERLHWFNKYITVKQDTSIPNPFKLGINNTDGWAAYINNGSMYLKKFNVDRHGSYPDLGVSYETYVNESVLEMECLSPVVKLGYDMKVVHTEKWNIVKCDGIDKINTENLDNLIKKILYSNITEEDENGKTIS